MSQDGNGRQCKDCRDFCDTHIENCVLGKEQIGEGSRRTAGGYSQPSNKYKTVKVTCTSSWTILVGGIVATTKTKSTGEDDANASFHGVGHGLQETERDH